MRRRALRAAGSTNLLAFHEAPIEDETTLPAMRKSQAVPLTLLAAAALTTASGCDDRPREVRNCVDDQNHIVSDEKCDHPAFYGGYYGTGSGGFRYLYGGASGGTMGDTVIGGNANPDPDAVVFSGERGSVVRGGFGGGEGEGGHGGGE